MDDSILSTVKDMLGISLEDSAFDNDIVILINSTLLDLKQLGVIGSNSAFVVVDESQTWSDLIGPTSKRFDAVKSYIYMKVRMVFDPPSSSFVLESMNRVINTLEFRLNAEAESSDSGTIVGASSVALDSVVSSS